MVKEVEIISSPVGARYRDLALSNGQIHERRSMEIQFKEPKFQKKKFYVKNVHPLVVVLARKCPMERVH